MNKRIIHYLFIISYLFLPLPVSSTEVQNQILKNLEPNSITIIGETHRQPGSIQFFQSLITQYLLQNKCLTVALEIASDQQQLIDEIMQGSGAVKDIQIAPMIDHSAFRAMLMDLVKIHRNGSCLKLIAIDAEIDSGVGRDEWMTKKLLENIGQDPLLVLSGNLHTLKKVDWNISITKRSPFVAEILTLQGYQIRTYPQIWSDKTCNTSNRLIASVEVEALGIINNKLISLLNASEFKTTNDVINGIIFWECD